MDDLGMDDKIIENLNLIKIWQLKVAYSTCVKRFISSRVIRGSALVEMSDEFMVTIGSMRTEDESLLSYPLYEKHSE